MTRRALLAVLAHPDDESFGPGGTLAKYARAGVEVHIAIATDGAAGSVAEGYEDSRSELAAVRTKELEAAVKILGGTLYMLNYRDSGYVGDPANEHPEAFINADMTEATGRIVQLIREIRPQVVLTHDETGGYLHPDHIMCWKITKPAFEVAGDGSQYAELGLEPFRPGRLYYTAIPDRWLKVAIFMTRLRRQDPTKVGRNKDIDLTKIGQSADKITTRVNVAETWETKRLASAEHKTQGGGGGFGFFPKWVQKRLFNKEFFMRAYPEPRPGERETDMFSL